MIQRSYFPILDSLRFIASLCVFLTHSADFFKSYGKKIHFNNFIRDAGYYGVVFFFVLSGFLITWLLLREKKATGTINLRNFYIRRALRIAPLYYLIILLSFFVFPILMNRPLAAGVEEWKMPLLLYLCFLPNIASATGFYLATCFPTYTIGYEEQFYLVWPLVLRKVRHHLGYWLALLFFLPVLLQVFYLHLITNSLLFPSWLNIFIQTTLNFIPAFIAGAAAALLYLQGGEKIQAFVSRKIWTYLLTITIFAVMYFIIPGGPGYLNVISLLFAFLILNLIHLGEGWGKMTRIMSWGGKLSYSIYIYHSAVLIFVSFYFRKSLGPFLDNHPLLVYIGYLATSLILLLAVSAISYRYFERFFLRQKRRFHSHSTTSLHTGA